MKTLFMTLMQPYFDQIAAGTKKKEYRDDTPYWQKRLAKEYDTITFQNGYRRDAPRMVIEYQGFIKENGKFVIALGKVLEVKNYTKPVMC